MAEIVLTTLNARYAHAAFGLRYLMANLGELRGNAKLLEFDINQRPIDVLDAILAEEPKIVGVGVYIWNAQPAEQLVMLIKRVRPEITVIIGGPEVSYETDQQAICAAADYVITGEADLAFAELCQKILRGRKPLTKIIAAELPQFAEEETKRRRDEETKCDDASHSVFSSLRLCVSLPYDFYTDEDIAHRVVYVEASRGCPFKCEFCLSSLDVPVRNVPLDQFLSAMQRLLDRGLKQFKFVDRTFNLNLNFSRSILEFFLERYQPGLFLHFEMIPDRLPEALREPIKRFPAGALQFEVGIQTFNEEIAERISRRQDNARLEANLKFLHEETGVHVHADLIVGLPGEGSESFGRGFDRLVRMRPQEIQVGMLKRLRGTPIVRHDLEFGMIYSPHPPYEILQNNSIDFATMQRLRRFARYWDLIANSGNFVRSTPLIWQDQSPFEEFLRWSDWIFDQTGQTHAIALSNLVEHLFRYLTEQRNVSAELASQSLWEDYQRGGRSDCPAILRKYVGRVDRRIVSVTHAPPRQARHLAGDRGAYHADS
ncbi:MAG TPA: DUF4080 domain-containing protein [Tepidisphaeraceae bacterium]|nr:DUF4080 domain-containing protein [Tepidisphaeraceae bacterium]